MFGGEGEGPILDKGKIIRKLQELKPFLSENFYVATIDLFGCYATDEADEESDIGLLLTYSEPLDFTELTKLTKFLKKELGTQVNLVSKNYLSPSLKESVLIGAIPI